MDQEFIVSLTLLENFVFKADFGDYGYILTDEPPPLGHGEGPNPARLLATGVANCLAASLLFALQKQKQHPQSLLAEARGSLHKVDGFWRIAGLDVRIEVDTASIDEASLDKALAAFEDYCIVTQSIRTGIPVSVSVNNTDGSKIA